MNTPAWIAALGIAALGLLHLGWALGWTWPARDEQSLGRAVIGDLKRSRMPGAAACFVMAALLGVSAVLVVVAAGGVMLEVPTLIRVGAYGVMMAFVLRGAVGFFAEQLQPSLRDSPFARWNRRLYSPLALGLGLLVLLALRSH